MGIVNDMYKPLASSKEVPTAGAFTKEQLFTVLYTLHTLIAVRMGVFPPQTIVCLCIGQKRTA